MAKITIVSSNTYENPTPSVPSALCVRAHRGAPRTVRKAGKSERCPKRAARVRERLLSSPFKGSAQHRSTLSSHAEGRGDGSTDVAARTSHDKMQRFEQIHSNLTEDGLGLAKRQRDGPTLLMETSWLTFISSFTQTRESSNEKPRTAANYPAPHPAQTAGLMAGRRAIHTLRRKMAGRTTQHNNGSRRLHCPLCYHPDSIIWCRAGSRPPGASTRRALWHPDSYTIDRPDRSDPDRIRAAWAR